MNSSDSPAQDTFFFIPDISGFTQFIGDRDFQHGQHIIAELLEVLIDNNSLNLTVGEVEGDAIFFYKTGSPPDLQELLNQAERMYTNFHSHLKKYGVSRICNCNTCQQSSRLTLKFIAHYGQASFHKVKNYEKLFGKDVILVHRLLKNNIPEREYLLITNSLMNGQAAFPQRHILSWSAGNENYDLGQVDYTYAALADWYQRIPDPEIPKSVIYRVAKPLIRSIQIEASMDMVYELLTNLDLRKNYTKGLKDLEVKERELNRLNRLCTSFECSLEHDKCTFETSGVEWDDDKQQFSETLKQHPITFDYILERSGQNTTLHIHVHPAFSFPMNWIFNLFMKGKIGNQTGEMLSRIKSYSEKEVSKTLA